MDLSSFGIAGVASITAVCFLIGLIAKAVPRINNKLIPIACGLSGAVLGGLAFLLHVPEFPAQDALTAVAVGIVSGLAATGLNQVHKQLTKGV